MLGIIETPGIAPEACSTVSFDKDVFKPGKAVHAAGPQLYSDCLIVSCTDNCLTLIHIVDENTRIVLITIKHYHNYKVTLMSPLLEVLNG